jgi:hypothetical protein
MHMLQLAAHLQFFALWRGQRQGAAADRQLAGGLLPERRLAAIAT